MKGSLKVLVEVLLIISLTVFLAACGGGGGGGNGGGGEGGAGNGGVTISANLTDDCTYGQPYLLINGVVTFGGSPCGVSSVDVQGGLDIIGPINLVGIEYEGASELWVSLKITEFTSSSLIGSYNLTNMTGLQITCSDTGTFSMNKETGSDGCGGLTGNWRGSWNSSQ